MRYLLFITGILLLLFSCKKESDDILWERTFGEGRALYVRSASDSGIISCGILDGKAYLVKLSRERSVTAEVKYQEADLFSAAWADTGRFIAAGSDNGGLVLFCGDKDGNTIWDTLINPGFRIERARMVYSGSGNFLVAGTAMPDSAVDGRSGLIFVRFDTTGAIALRKDINDNNFLAAGHISVDAQGNIILPLTRKTIYARAKASVAKYNSDFQKIWETELYNNPDFGAASFSATCDNSGNIFVTGKTEVSREAGTVDNSFLASLSTAGAVRWKKYLEQTNAGKTVALKSDLVYMLNRNCFVIDIAELSDGADAGKIRMYKACDSKNTDATGEDMDFHYDGNILAAGSKSSNFYLSLKSETQ
jgi:hypothetical protein